VEVVHAAQVPEDGFMQHLSRRLLQASLQRLRSTKAWFNQTVCQEEGGGGHLEARDMSSLPTAVLF